jgi:transcriptional regulator with XRE-family HTH domain
MRRVTTRTAGTNSGIVPAHHHNGISGYVLKVARESVGLSQEQFAERLGVDPNTIQSWETGRRPVKSIQLATLARLRHALRQLGANQQVLAALQDASEGDHLLDYVFMTSTEQIASQSHPLASWVMKRSIMDVLAWAVADHPPPWLSNLHRPSRRGPVADRPVLGTVHKQRFFDHLRIAAERALSSGLRSHPAAILLRWQAYYLSAWEYECRDTVLATRSGPARARAHP